MHKSASATLVQGDLSLVRMQSRYTPMQFRTAWERDESDSNGARAGHTVTDAARVSLHIQAHKSPHVSTDLSAAHLCW